MRQDLAGLYRPKTLDDLIGQETVTQTIRNSFKRGNLHHSYLLVGHYGSGKTSLGRILAAMENCEVSPGLNPCGKCKACSLIFAGKHTDVNEIDAASSAGKVEQVRQLKNDATFNPLEVKMKYFIVDECLPYDAKVSMSDGTKALIGDLVENSTREQAQFVTSRDMTTGENISQQICRYIKIPNDKQMYEIQIRNEDGNIQMVRITGNHSVFVLDKGKVKTEELEVGQKVFLNK